MCRVGQNRICTVHIRYYWQGIHHIYRVGQNHRYVYIYDVYTVFLAGKSPNIRPCTVYLYDSGQPYIYTVIHGVCMYGSGQP